MENNEEPAIKERCVILWHNPTSGRKGQCHLRPYPRETAERFAKNYDRIYPTCVHTVVPWPLGD